MSREPVLRVVGGGDPCRTHAVPPGTEKRYRARVVIDRGLEGIELPRERRERAVTQAEDGVDRLAVTATASRSGTVECNEVSVTLARAHASDRLDVGVGLRWWRRDIDGRRHPEFPNALPRPPDRDRRRGSPAAPRRPACTRSRGLPCRPRSGTRWLPTDVGRGQGPHLQPKGIDQARRHVGRRHAVRHHGRDQSDGGDGEHDRAAVTPQSRKSDGVSSDEPRHAPPW